MMTLEQANNQLRQIAELRRAACIIDGQSWLMEYTLIKELGLTRIKYGGYTSFALLSELAKNQIRRRWLTLEEAAADVIYDHTLDFSI